MRKIIGFLFPWRRTYRRLKLEKLWWHRLAIILFFIALLTTFLYSWALGDDANGPPNPFNADIHHWGKLTGTPNGDLIDLDSDMSLDNTPQAAPALVCVQKTIEMPNGKTATFPGIISDEAIAAAWGNRMETANRRAIVYGFGIALLITALFGYLLQAAYRALLYIVYGAIDAGSVVEERVHGGS